MCKDYNDIDIVIPTYRREENLVRLLKSISKQTLLPKQIFISSVKGSEQQTQIAINNINLPITLLFSEPSVCKQRNLGINTSKANYILLCDDDIELPENYIEKLYQYLIINQKVNIATGEEHLLTIDGKWKNIEYKISYGRLIYNFIFGLSIWHNLNTKNFPSNFITKYILTFYRKQNNHISKAGWPIVTNFSYPVMQTSIYGLGCSMIKSDKLKANLYAEDINQFGFGDNYDVALRINNANSKIHVLRDLHFKHYKSSKNRLRIETSYYFRTKTLYKFIEKLPVFKFKNRLHFLWSLLGNGLLFLFSGKLKHFYNNCKIILFVTYRLIKI